MSLCVEMDLKYKPKEIFVKEGKAFSIYSC